MTHGHCPLSYCNAPVRRVRILLLLHYVTQDSSKIPPYLSLPKGEQMFSQLLVICCISQSPDRLGGLMLDRDVFLLVGNPENEHSILDVVSEIQNRGEELLL